jgi:RNA polymerase sigma-B factor
MLDPGDAEKRAALFADYRRTRDRELRNQLVEANVGLAHALARRYSDRGESLEDLTQVALVGLVKAVERFEPERGLAFSSFAAPTIEGELKRHFRDRRWALRMPRRLQEVSLEVNQSAATLAQRQGRSPTIAEIARDTGLTEEAVLEGLEASRAAVASSLDAATTASGEEGQGPGDQLGDDDVEYERIDQRLTVSRLLARLPPREREIVTLRFYDGLTQSEIAVRFGISQMQVSRLLAQSLDRLRAGADAEPG